MKKRSPETRRLTTSNGRRTGRSCQASPTGRIRGQAYRFCGSLFRAALLLLVCSSSRAITAPRLACTRLNQGHWQVYVANADGANPRRVTDSPWDKRCLRSAGDGKTCLARDNEGKLHRLDLSGSGDTVLNLDFEVIKDFDFNPQSGFLIASYAPNALDNVCVWHVAREGQQKRLLIPDPYLNELPRWLPGGTQFLYAKSHAGRSQICVAELAEPGGKTLLKQNLSSASDPCPSPDGSKVLFCAQGRSSIDLWICAVTGADAHELYSGPGLEAEPAWSPDGRWAYFTTWDGSNFRVGRIRPDGSEFEMVSPSGVDSRCPLVINVGGVNE
jgi:Tol biopolymer transport system component